MEENNANTIDAQAQAAQQDQIPPIPEAVPAAPSVSSDPAQAASTPAHQTTSGLAIAGLVLGILAILGAFVPLLNILTAPFAIVGLILAIVGLMGINKGKHSGKGIVVAGVVLGAVALVVTLGMYGCAGAVASSSGGSSSSTASSSTAAVAQDDAGFQESDFVGTWDVVHMKDAKNDIDAATLDKARKNGAGFFFNLNEDGSMVFVGESSADTAGGTWKATATDSFELVFSDMTVEVTLKDGKGSADFSGTLFEMEKSATTRDPSAITGMQSASTSSSSSAAKEPAANAADSGEVSPDVKEALDSYEAVMDDYVAFMKKYKDSGYSASMLSDYTDMMQKYTEFSEKINAMDTNSMSNADYAYYIEVTSRVSQKLLEAM